MGSSHRTSAWEGGMNCKPESLLYMDFSTLCRRRTGTLSRWHVLVHRDFCMEATAFLWPLVRAAYHIVFPFIYSQRHGGTERGPNSLKVTKQVRRLKLEHKFFCNVFNKCIENLAHVWLRARNWGQERWIRPSSCPEVFVLSRRHWVDVGVLGIF